MICWRIVLLFGYLLIIVFLGLNKILDPRNSGLKCTFYVFDILLNVAFCSLCITSDNH